MVKDTMLLNWKNQYFQNGYNGRGNLEIQCNCIDPTLRVTKMKKNKGGLCRSSVTKLYPTQ